MAAPRSAMLVASVLLVIFALTNPASAMCSGRIDGLNYYCDGVYVLFKGCEGKMVCYGEKDRTCTGSEIPCPGSPPAGDSYKCKFHKSAGVTGVMTKGTFEMEMVDDKMFKAIVNLKNIKGMVNAHIHLGDEGKNGAPVVFPFPDRKPVPPFSGEFKFTFTFNASDLDMDTLNSGGYYFNVHTKKYPDGEVRCNLA